MNLDCPVSAVRGVGEVRAEQLARLNIRTVGDLLLTLPARYEDRTAYSRIADLQVGDLATVAGTVQACGWVPGRSGKSRFEAHLADDSGAIRCCWFGGRYLQNQVRRGAELVVHGKVGLQRNRPAFQHPEFEVVSDAASEAPHTDRIVPVYPLTEDLPQRTMRRIMWEAVQAFADGAEEFLPDDTRQRAALPGLAEALRQVHFPTVLAAAQTARGRLVFNEFLCAQIVLAARKTYAERLACGIAHRPAGVLKQRLLAALPFTFTAAQARVLAEIETDMAAPHPMHRLLQGDVGCGKTMVAACALANAIECGSQTAIMAPTEILAVQHAATFSRYLQPLGVTMELLIGTLSAAAKDRILARIRSGEAQLAVGTHAMLQEQVQFRNLGALVIDEQHKFGVEQRGLLYGKGVHPDVLVMTATPIPRTLAMTVYGDLDVSVIDELPPGRPETVTRVIGASRLADAFDFIRKQIGKGRQAYLVYPVIAGSETTDLRSAEAMFAELRSGVFLNARLGLLHGRMSADERNGTMRAFREGRLDILVSTTVVEVGVDVPNATLMLIEHAERFGLAQLHQLRGRVGRGTAKSFCILVGNPATPEAWQRLKVMEETRDGFRIAEEDLRLRGMGNLLGPEQSGLAPTRVGDPVADYHILCVARAEAFRLMAEDPRLEASSHQPLREQVRQRHGQAATFAAVG
jgi:ATP-dependent DNA helicase RecG